MHNIKSFRKESKHNHTKTKNYNTIQYIINLVCKTTFLYYTTTYMTIYIKNVQRLKLYYLFGRITLKRWKGVNWIMFFGAVVDCFRKKQGTHTCGCEEKAFTREWWRGISGVGAGKKGVEAESSSYMTHCREMKLKLGALEEEGGCFSMSFLPYPIEIGAVQLVYFFGAFCILRGCKL